MSATTAPRPAPPQPGPLGALHAGRALTIVGRNALVARRSWPVFASGLFEPIFYLFSIGIGIGGLIGSVVGPGGVRLAYRTFVAPGLLASSAMTGAVFDATFNVFFKLKYAKTYDAILSTPIGVRDIAAGEVTWALIRGGTYSLFFLLVMAVGGFVRSWWGLLAFPACLLIGFAFAAAGMAATTFMRSWQDFDFVTLTVLPMFLFSATFYPLDTYPGGVQALVRWTPLYHGVSLVRELTVGAIGPALALHVAYLAVMGAIGLRIAGRRLGGLLLT